MTDVKWSDDSAFIPTSSLDGSESLVGLKSGENMKAVISTALKPYFQAHLSPSGSYTRGDLLVGLNATQMHLIPDVIVGNVLRSGGVGNDPAWGKLDLTTDVTGVLPPNHGGTGQSSYTVGDIVVASGATTTTKLNDVATGNVLLSGGVAAVPSYGKVGLTTHVSGVLPPSNGGTGVNNSTHTLTLGGNTAFSGAHSFTGTITGNTTVTFPTTGTLATTSQLPPSLTKGEIIVGTNTSPVAGNIVSSGGSVVVDTSVDGQIDLSVSSDALPTLNQGQLVIGITDENPVAGYLVSLDGSIVFDASVDGQIDLSVSNDEFPTLDTGQLIIGIDGENPVAGNLVSTNSTVMIDTSVHGQIDLTVSPLDLPILGQGQLVIGVEDSDPIAGNLISSDDSIKIDTSVDGQIDLMATSGGASGLQDNYEIENDIELIEDLPFRVFTQTSVSTLEAIVTPSSGSSHIGQYTSRGWTFISDDQISVTSFQYPDFRYTDSNSRVVGIFVRSTGQELLEWPVNPTDPLVSGLRTATLPYPLNLQAGVEYVIAVSIPPNENYSLNNDAVPQSGITVTGYTTGANSNTPIPLRFPTGFVASPNTTPGPFFQYNVIVPAASAQYNSGLDGDAAFYKVESSTLGVISEPSMSEVNINAIIAPYEALRAWNSDIHQPGAYTGTQWKYGSYIGRVFPTGSTNLISADNKYILQSSSLTTLQMSTSNSYVGSTIEIVAPGTGGFKLQLDTGQIIKTAESGGASTSSGGYLTNVVSPPFPNPGVRVNTILKLECVVANLVWLASITGELLFA